MSNKWVVIYDNYVGLDDDCFWQWWEVTDGEKVFRCDDESGAGWLAETLNELTRKVGES